MKKTISNCLDCQAKFEALMIEPTDLKCPNCGSDKINIIEESELPGCSDCSHCSGCH